MLDAFTTVALIAARCASVKADPSSVWNTTVPLLPATSGSSAASRWATWSVAVPGMVI